MKNILQCTGHEMLYDTIIHADNCTLFDATGNRYLDLESGVWCTSVGHGNPRIHHIINDQSKKIIHSGYCYCSPVIDYTAENLLRITGIGRGKCLFLCSGSEAVEFSVTMTKSFSDAPYFLTMEDSYLSAYGHSGEKHKNNWILFNWKSNDHIDTIAFDRIAAFVFEPGSSSGLVNFPPKTIVTAIVDRVRSNGGIIIANEVTTGMGRTGEWFGYHHYDIIPDIVAIGKGLGNGYPVSSIVVSEETLQRLNFSEFHYHQSHQNDPLGAVVANEVIEIIEHDGLIARSRNIGELIRSRLEHIKNDYGIIREIRGKGLMIAIEFEKANGFSYAEHINDELLRRHIILVRRPGTEIFRIDPALTITDNDVELFLGAFEEIISNIVHTPDTPDLLA